ncbi:hypothetical protein FB446DRAFT_713296 [Lentinula raphanica]|nr:hypothetical protein FB446DRAFT_713296 [Lentinula raphanica]
MRCILPFAVLYIWSVLHLLQASSFYVWHLRVVLERQCSRIRIPIGLYTLSVTSCKRCDSILCESSELCKVTDRIGPSPGHDMHGVSVSLEENRTYARQEGKVQEAEMKH